MRRVRLWLMVVLALPGSAFAAEGQGLTVFAAASLTEVLQAIGADYTAESGIPLRFSFAATSALARQVEAGAPADVFVSADQEWMDYLAERRLLSPGTRIDVVSNRLVLIAPIGSTVALTVKPDFALADALGVSGRLATGDPASVPVGRYAKAELTRLGVWASVEKRIVAADNVRTALSFVARGEVPLGIVYATDARSEPKVRVVARFPENGAERISYPAAALARAGNGAGAFVRYLASPKARAHFDRAGFGEP